MKFTCCLDCPFETQRFPSLLKHYRYGHNDKPINCNIGGCQKLLKNSRQYTKYIRGKYQDFWKDHCVTRVHRNPNIQDHNDDEENDNNNNEEDNNVNADDMGTDDEVDAEVDVHHCVGSLLLGLREKHKSTSAACSYVANGASNLLTMY